MNPTVQAILAIIAIVLCAGGLIATIRMRPLAVVAFCFPAIMLAGLQAYGLGADGGPNGIFAVIYTAVLTLTLVSVGQAYRRGAADRKAAEQAPPTAP